MKKGAGRKREEIREEIVYDRQIKVKKGYMYYIDNKGFVHEAVPGDPNSNKKLDIPPIRKMKGFIYYVNLDGYICRKKPTKYKR